ncbi:MAG: hypothetical protein GY798_12855 [Hyphomicrobiales bacterium]|nr:hypothetical protein [Hyphomicrobiales bacterium]
MPSFITDWAIPAVLCLLMFVVGLELRSENLIALIHRPRVVFSAIAAQLLIFPVIAIAVLQIVPVREDLGTAMIVLSLCPGGAISNFYVYLSNRNTELSVSLTAIATLLSPISIPAMLFLLSIVIGAGLSAPPQLMVSIILSLFLFILTPIVIGMLISRSFGEMVRLWRGTLQFASLIVLLALVIATGWTFRMAIFSDLTLIIGYAVVFTLGAMLVGYAASLVIDPAEAKTLVIEFSVRNVAIALLVGSDFLPGAALIGFLTGYFIIEALIIVPYALWRRARA